MRRKRSRLVVFVSVAVVVSVWILFFHSTLSTSSYKIYFNYKDEVQDLIQNRPESTYNNNGSNIGESDKRNRAESLLTNNVSFRLSSPSPKLATSSPPATSHSPTTLQFYDETRHDDKTNNVNVSPAQQTITRLTEELLQSNISYYVYEDPAMDQPDLKKLILARGRARRQLYWDRYGEEILSELYILEALKQHPLRVYNITDFDKNLMYVIPLSPGVTLSMMRSAIKGYNDALAPLYQHSIFQASQGGHNHILVSLLVPMHKWGQPFRDFNTHLPKLWNVTVANDVDWEGCQQLKESGQAKGNDFEGDVELYSHNLARHGFSLGLLAPPHPNASNAIPLLPATYDKFQSCQYVIFYHTRETPSMQNSTIYRHAPLQHKDALEQQFAPAKISIGNDLPPTEWMQRYTSSQFCLVIRGDTTHSHALIRAVKVGCIPVVVADLYPQFAPTLKSTIAMQDYAILVDEQAFVTNPVATLSTYLQQLTRDQIQEKLHWLAFAQRLFFTEHRESLFVPAFLKEAQRASRIPLGGPEYPY